MCRSPSAGLQWLAANATVDGVSPVVTYEHPSRLDAHSMENVPDVIAWRAVNDLVMGFSGAPGHQGTKPIGSYKYKETFIDRWDPVAARVGDAWDTLLRPGPRRVGRVRTFRLPHRTASRSRRLLARRIFRDVVYAPDRSAAGVLRALRAGSFFADHGRIVREVELQVNTAGLPRAAGAGETISVVGTHRSLPIHAASAANRVAQRTKSHRFAVELIASINRVQRSWRKAARHHRGRADAHRARAGGGLVLRARGFRILETGTRLDLYTNPVRIVVDR